MQDAYLRLTYKSRYVSYLIMPFSKMTLLFSILNGMRLDKCCHIHIAFCDNKSFESEENNNDYLRVLTQLSRPLYKLIF